MKETQEKAREAKVKAQVRVQVKKGARALVRVARVREQDKAQVRVLDKEARETGAKEQVKEQVKKGISKKRLT